MPYRKDPTKLDKLINEVLGDEDVMQHADRARLQKDILISRTESRLLIPPGIWESGANEIKVLNSLERKYENARQELAC